MAHANLEIARGDGLRLGLLQRGAGGDEIAFGAGGADAERGEFLPRGGKLLAELRDLRARGDHDRGGGAQLVLQGDAAGPRDRELPLALRADLHERIARRPELALRGGDLHAQGREFLCGGGELPLRLQRVALRRFRGGGGRAEARGLGFEVRLDFFRARLGGLHAGLQLGDLHAHRGELRVRLRPRFRVSGGGLGRGDRGGGEGGLGLRKLRRRDGVLFLQRRQREDLRLGKVRGGGEIRGAGGEGGLGLGKFRGRAGEIRGASGKGRAIFLQLVAGGGEFALGSGELRAHRGQLRIGLRACFRVSRDRLGRGGRGGGEGRLGLGKLRRRDGVLFLQRRQLADLRLGKVCGGGQILGARGEGGAIFFQLVAGGDEFAV